MKIIILILISFTAFAQDEIMTRECSAAALRYGNGEGDDYISKDCFDWVKGVKSDESSFSVKDKIQIMGKGNLIFISESKEGKYLTHIIAGIYSELKNLSALSASLEHREIYVVQEGELLVYSMDITGNVGPIRRWKIKGLSSVKSVSFKTGSDEIILSDAIKEIAFPRLTKSL